MLFATIGQWKVLVAMMVAGLLVGLVYDLLAALRRLLRAGTLLSLCADLAFGLMSALVLGLSLIHIFAFAVCLSAAIGAKGIDAAHAKILRHGRDQRAQLFHIVKPRHAHHLPSLLYAMARPLATAVFSRPRAHTIAMRGGFRMQQPTATRHTLLSLIHI